MISIIFPLSNWQDVIFISSHVESLGVEGKSKVDLGHIIFELYVMLF